MNVSTYSHWLRRDVRRRMIYHAFLLFLTLSLCSLPPPRKPTTTKWLIIARSLFAVQALGPSRCTSVWNGVTKKWSIFSVRVLATRCMSIKSEVFPRREDASDCSNLDPSGHSQILAESCKTTNTDSVRYACLQVQWVILYCLAARLFVSIVYSSSSSSSNSNSSLFALTAACQIYVRIKILF